MIFTNLENDVNEVVKDLEDQDALLGKMLLQPCRPANSSARALMDSVHIEHFLNIDDVHGEMPYFCTGYENRYGEQSTSFVESEGNYEVIAKIDKFKFRPGHHYYLIVRDIDTGVYDYIERIEYANNTESYGYLYKNSYIDRLQIGSIIKKGDVIKTSNGYDEFNNKINGVNLTTMYVSCDKNKEDSIIISNSAANKLKSNLINKTEIIINDNDILLNLYGDNTTYKTFPDVGEEVKDGTFCSIRRLLNESALYSLARNRLSEPMISDRNILISGRVADIDVYCNNPETLSESYYNQQLYFYHTEKMRFCQEINDFVGPLYMNAQLSDGLKELYGKCRDIVSGKQFVNDGKLFNSVLMKVTIIEPLPMNVGDKMADRYGGKGVVSYILPDELMPVLDNGTVVECIKNQSTCVNRENVGQLHELSLNFISSRMVDKFKSMVGTYEYRDMCKILYEYIYMIDQEQAEEFKQTCHLDNEYEARIYIESIFEDDAICVSTRPFRTNINIDTIEKIYDKFPWIEQYTVKVPMKDSNGNIRFINARRPMVVAKIYNYRLKQYAEEKFSVTSLSPTNLKSLNSKSKDKKNFETKFKKTPIMLGPMECGNLSHIGMEYVVMNLMMYSSSPQARRLFEELLTTDDPYNIDIKLDSNSKNRNAEIINALLKAVGLKLEFTKIPKEKEYLCMEVMCQLVDRVNAKRKVLTYDDELQLKYIQAMNDRGGERLANEVMCEVISNKEE